MDINLNNKVAVITGGTAGIGLATAELFAREGSTVAICSRSESNVNKTLADFRDKGLDVYGEAVDVSDRKSLFDFADRVEKKFGGIDVWVSNAGILTEKRLLDTSEDEWHQILDINLSSVYYGGLIAAEKFKKRGGGVLINAASFASLMPSVGSGAYAATKAAIANMTRTLAAELAPLNIRVVGYIPGVIATPMTAGWIEDKGHLLVANAALQRVGTAEEIANALLFLASDKASFITGICLEISGGKFCVQNAADAWS
ncbi:MAG: SDR family NAD(P)-dependent oxidoreductase [Desulfobacula sp.]|jgi:3-oxoacyl-[acyl-carrier protein] reductase|nr:SDR family NAD(P)-dependent oxidoreductase [Desulfobacula sp.]